MSRHRSPAGHATNHAAAPVRRTMAAAAVGGALAMGFPTVAQTAAHPAAPDAELRLANGGSTDDATDDATTARTLRAAVQPVGATTDPEPAGFTVAALLKSAGLADSARRAEEVAAAVEATARCDVDLDGLGRVKPWVRDAAQFLSCLSGRPDLIGVAGRSRHSDHPAGLALDFLMRGERGDRLAACALANRAELGISYVIWKQRINYGDGWEPMENRGGDTENHLDHVHVSFERSPGDGAATAARCTPG